MSASALMVVSSTVAYYSIHPYSFMLRFKSLKEFTGSWKDAGISGISTTLIILSMLLFVICLFFVSLEVLLCFFLVFLLSVFYSFPLIKYRGKSITLREVSVMKLPLLSVSWAIITVIVPYIESENQVSLLSVIITFFTTAIFVLVLCIPFEIRDMKKDSERGIVNLALSLGPERFKTGGLILLAAIVIADLAAFYSDLISFEVFAALVSSILLTAYVIKSTPDSPSSFYCRFYSDGMMHVRFLFVTLMIS